MVPRLSLARIGAFALACVAAFPATAGAQAIADFERRLLPHQTGALEKVDRSFWSALSFLRTEEEKQRSLKADIMFGLSGDEAGERSLFRLNTGISLSRGVYPSELSVVSRFLLQVRDKQLQEEVTSFAITYDYHVSHTLQVFAFAERFTDSFLSIQNRYEIGIGGRIGKDFGFVGTPRMAEAVATVNRHMKDVQSLLASAPRRDAAPLPDYAAFERAAHNLDHVVKDTYSRLFVGIAASVFSELERAEMDTVTVPIAGSSSAADQVRSKALLESDQRYRLSIRPTLKFRPTPTVSFIVFPYFKLPLDGPHKVNTPSGRRLDYRRDVLSEMTWSVRQDQTGLENVDVIITVNHFFDNVPPALSQAAINAAAASGRRFLKLEAERAHRLVALTLRLRW